MKTLVKEKKKRKKKKLSKSNSKFPGFNFAVKLPLELALGESFIFRASKKNISPTRGMHRSFIGEKDFRNC